LIHRWEFFITHLHSSQTIIDLSLVSGSKLNDYRQHHDPLRPR
jgi:hypothetical protein